MSEDYQEPSEELQEEPSEEEQEEPSEMLQEEPSEESQEEPSEEQQEEPDEMRQEEPPEPDMPVFEWYIQVAEGKKAGPISFERLKSFAERGKIFPKTKVRSTEAESVWTPAGAVPELFPGIDPKEYAEPEKAEPEKVAEPKAEEPSSESVAVTDDSQVTTKPKVRIDVGRKQDEKPTEKPKEKKAPAFMIDTGAASSKKQDSKKKEEKPAEPVEKPQEPEPEPTVDEQPEEDNMDGSTVTSSPGIKISIGGAKKEPKKEAKKEKSSAAFKFKIDPTASKKKEEEPKEPEKPVEEVVAAEPEPAPEEPKPEKKKDASSPGIKISIGAPVDKKKTDDKSASGKKSEKSAFKVAVKPTVQTTVKAEGEETKKTDDSAVVESKSEPKKRDKKEKDEPAEPAGKKASGTPLLLRIAAVLCFLVGLGAAGGLFFLGRETFDTPLSGLLSGTVFLFGTVTMILFLLVAHLFSKINEQQPREPEA